MFVSADCTEIPDSRNEEGALEMSSVGRPPLYVWVECIQISNILSEVNTPEKSSVWQPPLWSSLDVYLSLLHSNLNHSKWSKCTRKVVCMATVILFKPLCMTETLSFYLLMSIIPTAFQIQSRHCIVYTLTHSGLVMPWGIFEKVVCKITVMLLRPQCVISVAVISFKLYNQSQRFIYEF